jgi:hypothetical protein
MTWIQEQVRQGMNGRTYALLGALVVTLLWIQSLDSQEKRARARAREAGGAVAVPSVAVVASAPKEGTSTPTGPGWGRDPFARRFGAGGGERRAAAPRSAPVAPAAGLYLQGVMNGPSGRTALINGEIYQEGQRIGTREILEIGARSVLLLDKGTVTTLTIKGDGS